MHRLANERHDPWRPVGLFRLQLCPGIFGYLARLAKDQARRELLNYSADEYLEGKASLSELSKKTGLDVPTIMDEVASIKGKDRRAVEAFCPRSKRSRS